MCVVLIFIENVVLDSHGLHKIIGPFESSDAAKTYIIRKTGEIEEEVTSLEDREDDDFWSYLIQPVVAP